LTPLSDVHVLNGHLLLEEPASLMAAERTRRISGTKQPRCCSFTYRELLEAKMVDRGPLSFALALILGVSTSALAKTEKEFISDAIKGDDSEIAMGQLAVSKSGSDQVKAFGQTLIDDHSKAKIDASAVATNMGVSLPTEMSADVHAEMTKLQQLSGRDFDKEFVRVMVEDHQKDIAEFKKEAGSGQGPIPQLAAQTLPTLEKHLRIAQSLKTEK
jgi:putative membrane protein